MWRGVATQVRTHRTHGTQKIGRLRQDATPTDQTQGPFLLMHALSDAVVPNIPAAPVNVSAAGQLGQALAGAAVPNVPAAAQLAQGPPETAIPNLSAAKQVAQAPPGAASPNVPAAQVNVPAARQLREAPLGAACPNVPAAGQRRQAPLGAAKPNLLAAQVNVSAAGQLRETPPVRLYQRYLLHPSTSLLPKISDRLPWVMFLPQVRIYLFNLVMILPTHK